MPLALANCAAGTGEDKLKCKKCKFVMHFILSDFTADPPPYASDA
jgi:hypothetical protein